MANSRYYQQIKKEIEAEEQVSSPSTSTVVSMRLDIDVLERINQQADNLGIKRNKLMNIIIKKFLKEAERENLK